MKFETIRNIGKVGTEFFKSNAEGIKVSRDFLTQLVEKIAERSIEYYKSTGVPGDHIFANREKQFHSVVCPSIADLTEGSFVIEHPVKRKPYGGERFMGHADYWIKYRSYCFLMELKHEYCSTRASSPRSEIANKFKKAVQQLKDIKTEQCRELTLNQEGLVKIALEAIPFYHESDLKIDVRSFLADLDFESLFPKLMDEMKTDEEVHMRALWILNKSLIDQYEYPDHKHFEIYPALGFIANISDLIR